MDRHKIDLRNFQFRKWVLPTEAKEARWSHPTVGIWNEAFPSACHLFRFDNILRTFPMGDLFAVTNRDLGQRAIGVMRIVAFSPASQAICRGLR